MFRSLLLRSVLVVSIAAAGALTAGCSLPTLPGFTSYYAITDPATGRVYYADQLRREERGAVEFPDAASGAWVSLPSAEVREISKDEFRANARP